MTQLTILGPSINLAVSACHKESSDAGWWHNKNGVHLLHESPYVVSNKIALIHSELSEALEGDRKGTMDSHIPHRKTIEVELADAAIRLFDLAGALDLDLGGAVDEKRAYNLKRADHQPEARASANGKKY